VIFLSTAKQQEARLNDTPSPMVTLLAAFYVYYGKRLFCLASKLIGVWVFWLNLSIQMTRESVNLLSVEL
jgi:hypothetical protein